RDRHRGRRPPRRRAPARARPPGRKALHRPDLAAEARPLSRATAEARPAGAPGVERGEAAAHLTPPMPTASDTPWRIVFMGTPAFACPSLAALLAGPDPVVAVVCQPDRPRGRGLEVLAPVTKRLAERHGIAVLQPERVRDAAFYDTLRALAPDLGVVVAYGRI